MYKIPFWPGDTLYTSQALDKPSCKPLYDETNDYINEDHIHEFAKALVWDSEEDLGENDISLRNQMDALGAVDGGDMAAGLSPTRRSSKPDLIVSKSDWYPVHTPMAASDSNTKEPRSKRASKSNDSKHATNEFRASAGYLLLRWPILIGVLMWMGFLGGCYSAVRFWVALSEYYFTWTGDRKRLRDRLRASKTYEEWVANALALDRFLNLDKWSSNPKFSYYDYKTLRLTINKLRQLKNANMDSELLIMLQGCVKTNFAGIENRQLYSHRYYGTKNLVEDYIQLVTECIDHITDSESIPFATKRKFFRFISKNYGKTALCLSGGACFAYTHFGVIKALLDNNLLPSIVSGTSGGGVVAALACTRTDEELKKLLVPELARKITACEDPWWVWVPRFWRTGARFDSIAWARKCNFFTKGSMTFQEAFKYTGRKLNVSTVPADPHSPVILCNNITSPNCIIWSALLASSAVPGILNPVVLMMKNPDNGRVVPFSLGNKWRDGSLRTDIPIDALNTYYNVNFSVVSQVNPHISLFFYAPKGTVGRPVALPRRYTNRQKYASFRGGFLGAAVEQLLRLEITKWLKIIKNLDLLPHLLEQDWSNIWLQRFSGTITVWPRNRISDFLYILSDPTVERLEEMLMKGQRSMFPRLLFIRHRMTIERAIERGRKATRLGNKYETSHVMSSAGTVNDTEVHGVRYHGDDDETGSSEEDVTMLESPFARQFGWEEQVSASSRTASPEVTEDELEEPREPKRRYTVL
ncbi:hypothetical protein PSN45_001403 [Yamadazyma tenuis]|uniref:Patatin-like phospholipase domain-containing protein n=1 Tax=Candida tenuis (strain ATCC 10573 / BCRC 21748 / CBS 615 / JCM 9827 / NBRC 10315 / NRRL Y-1498 / VKM Y-70) TaxID=590646 RepID=G3BCD0_CANTC|nr:FabD/lysophospholipase-like protein [Yamadazyma tenuis ATCC 10573]EGV60808.1 FabD/lysophospholipase-like protein [Yamadazyma tenuis ATCC 10573]WEJ93926.1 hypothetical protein PSN45_001403 [Yamadazyma tenuis]